MFFHDKYLPADETIVAIITPPGEGGIAALRLAGKNSLKFLNKFFRGSDNKSEKTFPPFLMRYGNLCDMENAVIDEITAVFMPAGKSYTGEDQVEIFCHGGRQVVKKILDLFVATGARLAEPGEFTRLAFLNGRIDLSRAEAVAEVIAAHSERSLEISREHLLGSYAAHIEKLRADIIEVTAEIEASIDFPEEEITPDEQQALLKKTDRVINELKKLLETYTGGKMIREGITVAIGGRPNAGKSSLFNLFLKQERALVNPKPGTTRDYLSEWIELEGLALNLVDTAGLRKGGGDIEKAGQDKAFKLLKQADLVIWLIDLSLSSWPKLWQQDIKMLPDKKMIIVGNKIDLLKDVKKTISKQPDINPISCLKGTGIKTLKKVMIERIMKKMPDMTSGLVVTSARHKQKLSEAVKTLKEARGKIKNNESPEIVAFELNKTTAALDEITGKIYNEDILDRIFAKFCIGK